MSSQTAVIRKGLFEDLERIVDTLAACKTDLERKGLNQWQAHYPNRAYFISKLEYGELYVIECAGELVGAFVLDEDQIDGWHAINWGCEGGRHLVLHAFFIHPNVQSRGFGYQVIAFCEEKAEREAYDGIRFDVFAKNENSLRFYEKRGYERRGEIEYASKPEGNRLYYCYDKLTAIGRNRKEKSSV